MASLKERRRHIQCLARRKIHLSVLLRYWPQTF